MLFSLLFIVHLTGFGQFSKAEMQASGLTCSMCNNAINKSLRTLSFVESVNSDPNKNLFEIKFKDSQQVDFDQIRKKVEGAGFSVANLWVFTSFTNQKIGENEELKIGGLDLRFVNVKDQTLSGEHKIKIIDKNFILSREYKKYASRISTNDIRAGFYNVTI